MTSSQNMKICINILSLCIHQQKTRNPKSECFFIANSMTSRVFRGFERLSSSYWRWVIASYSQGWNSPQISVCGRKLLTVFWFMSHNFRTRYASNQSRTLKIRFRVMNPKKHWAKKFRIGLWPRARQNRPKIAQTCSYCDVTHKEPKIQDKNFFLISRRRLA